MLYCRTSEAKWPQGKRNQNRLVALLLCAASLAHRLSFWTFDFRCQTILYLNISESKGKQLDEDEDQQQMREKALAEARRKAKLTDTIEKQKERQKHFDSGYPDFLKQLGREEPFQHFRHAQQQQNLAKSGKRPEKKQKLECDKPELYRIKPNDADRLKFEFETEVWLQYVPRSVYGIRRLSGEGRDGAFEVAYWHGNELQVAAPNKTFLWKQLFSKYVHELEFQSIKADAFHRIPPLWIGDVFDKATFTKLRRQWSGNNPWDFNVSRMVLQLQDSYGRQVCVKNGWWEKAEAPGYRVFPRDLLEDLLDKAVQKDEEEQVSSVEEYAWVPFLPGKRPTTRSTTSSRSHKGTVFSDVSIAYKQPPGSHTCMVSSIASALHHFGLEEEAATIQSKGEQLKLVCAKDLKHNLHELIRRVLKGRYQLRKDRKGNYYNPLGPLELDCPTPVWAVLKPPEGSSALHCVAFYDGMIFDPAEEYAMPNNKESLDKICGGQGCYSGLHWSKRLVPVSKTSKKKNKRKKAGNN